jgi:hypothetical protein
MPQFKISEIAKHEMYELELGKKNTLKLPKNLDKKYFTIIGKSHVYIRQRRPQN